MLGECSFAGAPVSYQHTYRVDGCHCDWVGDADDFTKETLMRKAPKYNELGQRWCSGSAGIGTPGHFIEPESFTQNAAYEDGLQQRCKSCLSRYKTTPRQREYRREIRENRKSKGLCLSCGGIIG